MRKILTSLLVFVILAVSAMAPFVQSAHAQVNPWYKQTYEEWVAKVDDRQNPTEIFGERYTAAQVQWVIYGLTYMIYNVTGDGATFTCVLENTFKGGDEIADQCGGLLIETVAKYTQSAEDNSNSFNPFTKPIATSEYIKHVSSRLTLTPEVNAQGFGFTAANPVLGLWEASRNMTYVLMVLVIIAMAFMIMFRVKLNPQTVITVQSALPRIVITLILITFSYAIGGLLIDMMYVVIGLVAALITGSGLVSDTTDWSYWFNEFTNVSIFLHLVKYFVFFMIGLITSLPGILAAIAVGVAISVTGGFLGLIALLVIVLFLLFFIWKSLKIGFLLLKAYVMIIFLIAFAPFILLIGVIGQGGFGNWIKSLVTHLAVFPTVGLMMFLAFYFLAAGMSERLADFLQVPIEADFGASGWSPPLTFGGITVGEGEWLTNPLYLIISFSIVMLIPKVADIIKSAIEGRSFAYGAAIGTEGKEAGGMIMGYLQDRQARRTESAEIAHKQNPNDPAAQRDYQRHTRRLRWLQSARKSTGM